MNREQRKRDERTCLQELIMKGGSKYEVFNEWCSRTRKNRSAFYARKDELPEDARTRYESLIDRRQIDSSRLKKLIRYVEDEDRIHEKLLKSGVNDVRISKEEVCEWWCAECEATSFAFETYWMALRQEVRDMVAE
jgi:hypothetical protein